MESISAEYDALNQLNYHILQNFHQVPLHRRNDKAIAKLLRDSVFGFHWDREKLIETEKSECSYNKTIATLHSSITTEKAKREGIAVFCISFALCPWSANLWKKTPSIFSKCWLETTFKISLSRRLISGTVTILNICFVTAQALT